MPARMITAILLALLISIPAYAQDVDSQLIEAAQNGQAEEVQALLEGGADVDAKDEAGMTALMWAALGGHTDTVKGLLDAGADVSSEDKQGTTARLWAAGTEIRQLLQNSQKDINAQLIDVAENDQTEKVQALLEAGAEANAKDQYGTTAVTLAAAAGSTDTVRALLDAGADANVEDQAYQTAVRWAAAAGHTNTVSFLLDLGVDANDTGVTALELAARNGHTETLLVLLARGASVNAKDRNNLTALMRAAEAGHTDAVRVLLDAGADANAKDNDDRTVLMMAERLGRTEVVELLKNAGAKVTQKDVNAELVEAASNGQTELVKRLLRAGADVNVRDNDSRRMTVLMAAASKGHSSTVQALLDGRAKVDAKDSLGATALMWAAYFDHTETVQLLLKAGAKVNAKNDKGGTALFDAVDEGNASTVIVLLDAGADANAKEEDTTPLMHAAVTGDTYIIQILLANGAEVNEKTKDGMTPLITATVLGRTDAVRTLLEAGANTNSKLESGATALMIAERMGHKEIVDLLTGTEPRREVNESLQGRTYINRTASFTLTLPDGWKIDEDLRRNSPGTIAAFTSSGGEQMLQISPEAFTGSLKAYKELTERRAKKMFPDYKKLAESDVTIDGRQAMFLIYRGKVGGDFPVKFLSALVPRDGRMMFITASTLESFFDEAKPAFEDAVLSFKTLDKKSGDASNSAFTRGQLLGSQGRHEEAVSAFRDAVRLQPDFPEAYINMCAALGQLGDHEGALHACQEAIRLKPDEALAHMNITYALRNLGRNEEALDAYQEAVRLNPDIADSALELGLKTMKFPPTKLPPVTNPTQQLEFQGFSVLPPSGENWFIQNQGTDHVTFTKETTKGEYHTVMAWARSDDAEYANWAGLLVLAREGTLTEQHLERIQEQQWQDSRYKPLEVRVALDSSLGKECARFDFTVEDRGVPYAPDLVFVLIGQDFYCLHPDSSNLVVRIAYSQRLLQGEQELPIESEVEPLLESLTCTPLQQGVQ